MTIDEAIQIVRECELEHEPDGYPCIRTELLTVLVDELDRLRAEAEKGKVE